MNIIKMNTTLNTAKNIQGVGQIFMPQNDEIDISELEKTIIEGIQINNGNEPKKNFVDEFNKNSYSHGISQTDDIDDMNIDDILNSLKNGGNSLKSYKQPVVEPNNRESPAESDNENEDEPTLKSNGQSIQKSYPEKKWSSYNPNDQYLNNITVEERKQTHINNVLNDIGNKDDDAEFLEREDIEDELARILEQIDQLRTNLTGEGLDLSRIPEVNQLSTEKEIKSVWKILQIKNDRLRYCDFFEEGILTIAYGIESLFNGEREILGSKIDMTGYSNTVKVKLRRMRYDTSNFVSGIMQGYNISPGWRIMLELVPSLFLYSRDRRLTSNQNLISDERYKDALMQIPK